MSASTRLLERISARRGRATLLNALATACFSFVAISNVYQHPARTSAYVILWAIWMTVTLVWVFGVPGGFRLSKQHRAIVNDELVQSHQAFAARFGLTVAMLGLVALSLSGFLHVALPGWTIPAMTSAIVVTTALFFAWLQLRHE